HFAPVPRGERGEERGDTPAGRNLEIPEMTTKRSANALSRRDLLRLTAAGCVGFSMSGWLERMAAATAKDPQRKRACILLWMNGGPSQMDTVDPKPRPPNRGPFKENATKHTRVRSP